MDSSFIKDVIKAAAVLITKTLLSLKSLEDIASLFYREGRQALLERVRSKTELTKLDVVKKQDEIALTRIMRIVEVKTKVENRRLQQQIDAILLTHLRNVGKPPLSLPPPSPDLGEDRDGRF